MSNTKVLDLSGSWSCALDPRDVGIAERWFTTMPRSVRAVLPGSLTMQRIGNPVTLETLWTGTIFDRSFFSDIAHAKYREPGNIKVPFWLQPETVFVGAAWYQREFEIPEDWSLRRLVLSLERAHWETQVWCDDCFVGSGESLSTSQGFEFNRNLTPGRHRLTIRMDNRVRIQVGENAHSVSDHTQGNWNGIIGRIELLATSDRWVENVQVFPEVKTARVRVTGTVRSSHAAANRVTLCIEQRNTQSSRISLGPVEVEADGAFSVEIGLGPGVKLWDEFSPALYRATIAVEGGDETSVVFGMREVECRGRHLLLNGRRIFLRGTLDCCAYPLTGHPPMDVESWRRTFEIYRAHGLNHVRFHSWCPPEAAFVAADEMGLYLQIECASWANDVAVLAFNSPAGIGDGREIDAWSYREAERILSEYGNHPSFLLFAQGNEPGGPHHAKYLSKWVEHFRARDPRRLYTGAAGWPELPENQFHVVPAPRIHQWGDGLNCRVNGAPPATTADYDGEIVKRQVPVISHEIGQWCAYPPIYDTDRYVGPLKAKNYEIFRDLLQAKGLGSQAREFVQSSGKLQALLYKEEVEASLRTRELAGFQLLGLQDFPGQGTAPVGVLDVFGHSKGYVAPSDFRQFCGPTVLLAKLDRRIFEVGEMVTAQIEVAHFGPSTLKNACAAWALLDVHGGTVRSGRMAPMDIPTGGTTRLGRIEFNLSELRAPAKYVLRVSLPEENSENQWDIWLYPVAHDTPLSSARWTFSVDDALARAGGGERVLLFLSRENVHGEVALGFATIFWNTWCTQKQAPHTLGVLCDPVHPALAGFPTEFHSNWQWWYVLQNAGAMILDHLPVRLKPIVQVVDDWFTNRRLGLLFEARLGAGKVLVCSANLPSKNDPVSQALLASLSTYLGSDAFSPTEAIQPESLRSIAHLS